MHWPLWVPHSHIVCCNLYQQVADNVSLQVLVPIWGAFMIVPTLELFPHVPKLQARYVGTNSTCFQKPTNTTLTALVL